MPQSENAEAPLDQVLDSAANNNNEMPQ